MLSDFDIAMSASLTDLLLSMGQFAQASIAFAFSLGLILGEEA